VILDLDDGVTSADRRPPELAVTEVAERADEAIELTRQGLRRVLERERVELPSVGGMPRKEVENSVTGFLLEFSTTSGANPELAGFALEEETAGFEVADDERVAAACLETVEASGVRVDVR
jgi:hypothetical protein